MDPTSSAAASPFSGAISINSLSPTLTKSYLPVQLAPAGVASSDGNSISIASLGGGAYFAAAAAAVLLFVSGGLGVWWVLGWARRKQQLQQKLQEQRLRQEKKRFAPKVVMTQNPLTARRF